MPSQVTLVTPHRRHTSGGVYAIEQFATGLADSMRVHLAVQKGPPGTLTGVSVAAARALDCGDLPDADALIIPADSQAGERLYSLPPRKGRPVLLFQGYGAPGNPVVRANLDRARAVVAVASWLMEDAIAHGCQAARVKYGLDRRLFAPGAPASGRDRLVAMLVHSVAWKGTGDGLEALRRIRRAVPDCQVCLFGVSAPDTDLPFIRAPDRSQVGELLRRSAVFLCPSWEEGFGMPGLEALACGAALATTDTKGSREYAIHEQTALVSPPGAPGALADHAIELLRDNALRGRLAGAGQALAERRFGTWKQASATLAAALSQFE